MYGQPGYVQPGYGQPMMQPGFQQPMMQPTYMPAQQGPTVINIDNDNDGSPCQFCSTNTEHIVRKKVGCTAIAWGCCLFYFTGFLCCLPCCMDGCKDTELVCIKCQQVKNTIPANCC